MSTKAYKKHHRFHRSIWSYNLKRPFNLIINKYDRFFSTVLYCLIHDDLHYWLLLSNAFIDNYNLHHIH